MAGWGIQEQAGWRKGPWTAEEDKLLTEYETVHGEGRWSTVARSAGLNRSGKSCRLRWVNYLRPGLKRGHLTPQEESIIIELHALWGNKWSMIARCLPGRTDNEIKNYWRTHFKNKAKSDKKPRIRALRRQKQLQQEQKQPQQQQLVQQQQRQVVDVQAECDYPVSLAQARQDMVLMYPNMEEQQCFPTMFQDQDATISDFIGEEGLWGSLWNLDDLQFQFNQNYDPNKFSVPTTYLEDNSSNDQEVLKRVH